MQLGEPGAVELARQAHALAPADAAVADTLGWLLARGGNLDEGLRFLREAHARAPREPEIRFHIAEVLHRLGRADAAREELRGALQLSNDFASAEAARTLLQELSQ
jgi:Flp pilus assembly protein TadD